MDWLFPIAVLSSGALFGAMTFFAGVMAPLVFAKLPRETAGEFMTAVFPIYFLVMAGVAGLSGLCAVPFDRSAGILLGLACAVLLFSRFWVLPRLDRARAAAAAGDTREAGKFARIHRASFLLHLLMMLMAALALVGVATAGRGI